ncbi:MAG: zinc-dependent metalloprotease [Ilumatobacteraceae bacterium]
MAAGSSGDNPLGDNPFGNLPMFGDLAKALSGQGPLNWDAARQFAQLAATEGGHETNVDPAVRFALAELARIAEPHVLDVTAQDVSGYEVTTTTPGAWAQQTLDAYRPLFTELAVSLAKRPAASDEDDSDDTTDPMMAMMAGLSQMMAPAMLGMAIGSMVGRLGKRAFGQYDLPIPRAAAAGGRPANQVSLVPSTVDAFAQDWSLPRDSMRLWVLAHELTTHAVFSVEHIREGLSQLVRAHVAAFQPDPSAVAEKLGSLDMEGGDPMAALQKTLGDPEILLGAVESPAQAALKPQLDASLAAVIGYVDFVVDAVTNRLIGGDAQRISEAVRRRRVETSPDDVFVERLLGLHLTRQQVERGRSFVNGVFERGGQVAVNQLLERPGSLPTPAEVDAPGLWMARLDIAIASGADAEIDNESEVEFNVDDLNPDDFGSTDN